MSRFDVVKIPLGCDAPGMTAPADAPEGSSPAAPAARPYHHGDLPASLLEATGALIRRDGIGAVSIRAVAREVGVSHAAPAHHFGDKQGLLTAFAMEGFTRFRAALQAAADEHARASPEDRLRACGFAYWQFVAENLAYYEVMFRPELLSSADEEFAAVADGSFEVLVDLIAECLDDPSGADGGTSARTVGMGDDARARVALVRWAAGRRRPRGARLRHAGRVGRRRHVGGTTGPAVVARGVRRDLTGTSAPGLSSRGRS